MAKKSSVEKNKYREALVFKYKKTREILKNIVKSGASLEERLSAQDKLNKLPRNSSPVRVRKRCALTGRARGYMGMFKLSRIKFRELALDGLLPGVKKTSW